MTDFCPKCGKKADNGEKICSVCGSEITSISQYVEKNKYGNKKSSINFIKKASITVLLAGVFIIGFNVLDRYFNAGKNIANTANAQKSELKILKRTNEKLYNENNEDEEVIKNEKMISESDEHDGELSEEGIENRSSDFKSPVLHKKEKYMKMMAKLDKEVSEQADSELDGDQERLLNYTSKIYKKYDTLLNMIYGDIISSLEDEDLEKLKHEEIEWIKKKEEIASSSVGSENTTESDENWVYFDSLATSTKDRCYYLIHKYMD